MDTRTLTKHIREKGSMIDRLLLVKDTAKEATSLSLRVEDLERRRRRFPQRLSQLGDMEGRLDQRALP